MQANKKFFISIILLFILWVIVAAVGIFTGTYDVGPIDAILNPDELSKTIFLNIRIPRVLMATIAGGTLALSGRRYRRSSETPSHRHLRSAYPGAPHSGR